MVKGEVCKTSIRRFDPARRLQIPHASQTIGTNPTSSYSCLGTSQTVVAIASGSSTTTSAMDALGDRVATSAGGSIGYLLPDLHGNAAAAFNAAGTTISDAFAYDAWGALVVSVTSARVVLAGDDWL